MNNASLVSPNSTVLTILNIIKVLNILFNMVKYRPENRYEANHQDNGNMLVNVQTHMSL